MQPQRAPASSSGPAGVSTPPPPPPPPLSRPLPPPPPRRVESSDIDDAPSLSLGAIAKTRAHDGMRRQDDSMMMGAGEGGPGPPLPPLPPLPPPPIYAQFTSPSIGTGTSAGGLMSALLARPGPSPIAAPAAGRAGGAPQDGQHHHVRNNSSVSSLTAAAATTSAPTHQPGGAQGHGPSVSSPSLSLSLPMSPPPPSQVDATAPRSASHAAALAAVGIMTEHQRQQMHQQQQYQQHQQLYHHHQQQYGNRDYQQQQQPQQQQQQQHSRHRSQTVPGGLAGLGGLGGGADSRPASRGDPPALQLIGPSVPRDTAGFTAQAYLNGLSGSQQLAATAAANLAFPRSTAGGAGLPSSAPSPPPPPVPDKRDKDRKEEKEKSSTRGKLFSKWPAKAAPAKVAIKDEDRDSREKPLPSPSGTKSALFSALNFSTSSLVDSPSFYSLNNSSTATIKPADPEGAATSKEKESGGSSRKHHFLSRGKHKAKDDHHHLLPLSSAASNSKPSDPSAPSSLYSFSLPPSSPAATSGSFPKGIHHHHLHHHHLAGRKDKKGGQGSEGKWSEPIPDGTASEWAASAAASGNLSAVTGQPSGLYDPFDPSKYGLNNMSADDAWPYLKAKLQVVFEGEDLRIPIEDLNRVVTVHLQYCAQQQQHQKNQQQHPQQHPQRRPPPSVAVSAAAAAGAAAVVLDDLRELLLLGFSSMDHTLRRTTEDRLIPTLVELWIFTFTSVLPFLQAVFLPLDLELTAAAECWSGAVDVRRLVLAAYRDVVILPRHDNLKTIFSRLSLEFFPAAITSGALASPPLTADCASSSSADPFSSSYSSSSAVPPRPGTALSLDPSVASYNSTSTTLYGDGSGGGGGGGGGSSGRSRAISNVSFGSGASASDGGGGGGHGGLRPFTPSGAHHQQQQQQQQQQNHRAQFPLGSVREREQNVEDSKQVADMVGRMLQCMSMLSGLGGDDDDGGGGEGGGEVEELCKLLKLNWLGRGRTGRNRRGIVGGRAVRREDVGVGS